MDGMYRWSDYEYNPAFPFPPTLPELGGWIAAWHEQREKEHARGWWLKTSAEQRARLFQHQANVERGNW
jgi:hypothetical protein